MDDIYAQLSRNDKLHLGEDIWTIIKFILIQKYLLHQNIKNFQ